MRKGEGDELVKIEGVTTCGYEGTRKKGKERRNRE